MKRILAKQKMRSRQGFSLAELLFALLITSLAGLIVMGGIGVTTRLFQDVLLHSQTQLVMKEYMSELRSGFLCAEMDSPLTVSVYVEGTDDPAERLAMTNPAFAHSGYKCAGFYKLDGDVQSIDGKQYGVIVFQPTLYSYNADGSVTAIKTLPNNEAMPPVTRLISGHLSDDFPASLEYKYIADEAGAKDGKFVLSLTVRSNGYLSTGEQVVLSVEDIEITPTGK